MLIRCWDSNSAVRAISRCKNSSVESIQPLYSEVVQQCATVVQHLSHRGVKQAIGCTQLSAGVVLGVQILGSGVVSDGVDHKPKSYAEAVDADIDIEEGLRSRRARNEELYQMVLTNKPKSYAEAVDADIDIEEGLRSRRARRQQAAPGGRPAIQGAQSSQSSESAYQPQQQQPQVAQQSGHQRFRPHGQQFKKKSGSGSSGSGNLSSSGSRAEFCGFCGGKHPSMQCVGVSGNQAGQSGSSAGRSPRP
ncbi:hypothetical protein F511_09479 [Dorcoceras hygrometricum]|uniref:Uncharacterized protein n=1 Tax=Dorcoceras hygrometricum TaxID=472368 RepID=A0A2Z7A3K6_9LAMI|nr:hypothetical protein F511_09479 [Dorcoceras hygrometricum]